MVKRVLCVCAGNTARSVMMTAMLQKELGDEFQVESAGTNETADGQFVADCAFQCMQKRGIDVSWHRGRWIGGIDLSRFSHIVCVNWTIKKIVLGFLNGETGAVILIPGERGIPLLPGGGLAEYEDCATLLDRIIPEVGKQILE